MQRCRFFLLGSPPPPAALALRHANLPGQKIPCEFQIDVPGLGYLDQTPSHSLRAGTRLGLPLWLAEMLALAHNASDDNPPFLSLNLPPALSNDVIQALKADPRSVPIRDQSAHFYGLATRILDLFEERDLAVVLRASFVRRAAEIGLHARKVGSGSGSAGGVGGGGSTTSSSDRKEDANSSNLGIGSAGQEFLRGLDEWERQLFRHAHDGAKAGREFLDNVKRNY